MEGEGTIESKEVDEDIGKHQNESNKNIHLEN